MNTQPLVAIEYKASVNTPAGWRSVYMSGTAKQTSQNRVEVVEITHIDGDRVAKNMNRTGANRQQFDGEYFANLETGKKKNVSALFTIKEL